jgi:hypothetical protein
MKYSQPTTLSHPLSIRYPHFIRNINTIVKEEKGLHFPFGSDVAIDLEAIKENTIEVNVKGIKSVDMVLGMEDAHGNKNLLLVELKLDCNSVGSIYQNCKGKMEDSKLLLFGGGIPVYYKDVFVFNDKLLNVSRSVIARSLVKPNVEVLSIHELKTNYF